MSCGSVNLRFQIIPHVLKGTGIPFKLPLFQSWSIFVLVAHAKEETVVPEVAPNLDRYRKDRSYRYEDFAKREKNENISPFRAQVNVRKIWKYTRVLKSYVSEWPFKVRNIVSTVMIYKMMSGLCPDNLRGRLVTKSQISNYPTRNQLDLDTPRQNHGSRETK